MRLLTFGLVATSDAAGQFTFWIDAPSPCIKIDVAVSAPGFGPWRDNGVMVTPGFGPIFSIDLTTDPYLYTSSYGGAAASQAALCVYPSPPPSTP